MNVALQWWKTNWFLHIIPFGIKEKKYIVQYRYCVWLWWVSVGVKRTPHLECKIVSNSFSKDGKHIICCFLLGKAWLLLLGLGEEYSIEINVESCLPQLHKYLAYILFDLRTLLTSQSNQSSSTLWTKLKRRWCLSRILKGTSTCKNCIPYQSPKSMKKSCYSWL